MARRTVQGFAWLVYPDARTPDDRFHPGLPFEAGRPPGVLDFWPMPTGFGLETAQSGATDLVVTEGPESPRVPAGYKTAPAQLDEGFSIGGDLVRLARILGTRDAEGGPLSECLFEVDEG
ncbi:MAG TPA: hypothetical protein VF590_00570 [Isosphaeraceae bacterium]|jgi:hypothetical protein